VTNCRRGVVGNLTSEDYESYDSRLQKYRVVALGKDSDQSEGTPKGRSQRIGSRRRQRT
jgi:hypothetical protein